MQRVMVVPDQGRPFEATDLRSAALIAVQDSAVLQTRVVVYHAGQPWCSWVNGAIECPDLTHLEAEPALA
ncbi:hypothetical protein CKO28_02820 [Rhodovibrio sodomensis]|uniref:Uncharacterized protein n=1 Tax=Rhodovibrio sodomensis TaxID=1088 RepID=A0ABS1D9D3_9PROT|nr:hypothetical protein [Rhodovibrio sodomensis]MBK1666975.1 hypothetical protein [Rhodovibrio sodomensis]